MIAPGLVAVEAYLEFAYRPDREYIDGVILERNLGEWEHSRLQTLLAVALAAYQKTHGIRTVVEQRVQVAPARFRVPDLCAILPDYPVQPIFRHPPLLCIEILSRDDRMSEMQERVDDYLDFGVPNVWVIDPRTRRAWIYAKGGIREVRDGILRTAGSEIEIRLDALE